MVSVLSGGLILLAAIVFLGLGGLDKGKAFAESLKRTTAPSQATSKIEIAGGTGQITQQVRRAPDSVTTSVVTRRGKSSQVPSSVQISSKRASAKEINKSGVTTVVTGTVFVDTPTKKLRRTLTGKGTAQFSGGGVAFLTDAELAEVRGRPLTADEKRRVARFEARRSRKSPSKRKLKLSGREQVLRGREQEAISKSFLRRKFGGQSFFGGKLFANPDFALTAAERKARGL